MHDWSLSGVPHPNSPAGQHFDWSTAGIPHPYSPAGRVSITAPKLTLKQRFIEMLKLVPNHMAPELAAQFRSMLTPSSMAMIAATFTALAVSQAFGIGEVVDLILLVVGAFFVGMAVFTAAEDIVECVKTTVKAKTPADLDRAADYLAQAIAILGVVAFFALIAKIGEKFGGAASAKEEGSAGAANATEQPAVPPSQERVFREAGQANATEAASVPATETSKVAESSVAGEGIPPEKPIYVLGRQVDTAVAKDWQGHSVLDIPDWTLQKNDAFVQGIIDQKGTVYLGSPQTQATLWDAVNDRQTVFARELEQLRNAGYQQVGDYMYPPGTH